MINKDIINKFMGREQLTNGEFDSVIVEVFRELNLDEVLSEADPSQALDEQSRQARVGFGAQSQIAVRDIVEKLADERGDDFKFISMAKEASNVPDLQVEYNGQLIQFEIKGRAEDKGFVATFDESVRRDQAAKVMDPLAQKFAQHMKVPTSILRKLDSPPRPHVAGRGGLDLPKSTLKKARKLAKKGDTQGAADLVRGVLAQEPFGISEQVKDGEMSVYTAMQKIGERYSRYRSITFETIMDFYSNYVDEKVGFAGDVGVVKSGKLPTQFKTKDPSLTAYCRDLIIQHWNSGGDNYFAIHTRSSGRADIYAIDTDNLLGAPDLPEIAEVQVTTAGGQSSGATRVTPKIKFAKESPWPRGSARPSLDSPSPDSKGRIVYESDAEIT